MATLNALKRKIAALEAQVERVTKAEIGVAIAKIRRLMGEYGVTVEHLMDGARHSRSPASKKSVEPKTSKGTKPAKYRDPKSGATWSGLGRIPAWIAKAKSRDAFLIDVPTGEIPVAAPAPKVSVKRAASKKVVKATRGVKSVAPKVAVKKSVAPKKAPAVKKAVAKASPRKRASKKAETPAAAPAADAGATPS